MPLTLADILLLITVKSDSAARPYLMSSWSSLCCVEIETQISLYF
jgi:hypothetical protein